MFPYIKNDIFFFVFTRYKWSQRVFKTMTQIFCSEIVDFKWQSTTANKPFQITHNLYSQLFIEQKKFIVFYWWTCYIVIVLCTRTHNRSLPNSMKITELFIYASHKACVDMPRIRPVLICLLIIRKEHYDWRTKHFLFDIKLIFHFESRTTSFCDDKSIWVYYKHWKNIIHFKTHYKMHLEQRMHNYNLGHMWMNRRCCKKAV